MNTVLTIEKNEVFELAYRFATETSENVFLTGKAGTGKTTFLKYLKENCTKEIVVAAPTGVAAINAGGVTLHSLFQLPFEPFLPTEISREELIRKIRFTRQRLQLLRKMEMLVIDEISMVRSDVMDAIDTILRSVRFRHNEPFGGVQLFCIGDLHQLPPVAQNHEWRILGEYYESPFFFDSHAVREQGPLLIELDTIYRQKEAYFVTLLNKVRTNNMSEEDFELLHERYQPDFRPDPEDHYITLTSHNNQAEQINAKALSNIIRPAYTFKAEVAEEFPENMYPADGTLILKEGAQVMFLKNDPIQKRYFNGKIGIVQSLSPEEILVDCDGILINVQQETWEHNRYVINKSDGKLEQETLGTFTQYPLRLAWAITIHKSQGLTFERVMIDAGSAFSSGQVYVALSRCTSLDGIVLLSKIPATAIYSNENVIKGQQNLSHKGSLAERFAGARHIFTSQILEHIFRFEEVMKALNNLRLVISKHKDKIQTNQPGKLVGEWFVEFESRLKTEQLTGQKFCIQVSTLLKQEIPVEENLILQQRIQDAANHFTPKFIQYKEQVYNNILTTEYKEAADEVNSSLIELYQTLHAQIYQLEYCMQPFSVTSYLQHKLKFSVARVSISCYAANKNQDKGVADKSDLFNILKSWRDKICAETGIPVYMVANQASLKEIVTWLPQTKKDLMMMPGFGKAKSEKYGDEILDAVLEHCSHNKLSSRMHERPTEKTGKSRKKAI